MSKLLISRLIPGFVYCFVNEKGYTLPLGNVFWEAGGDNGIVLCKAGAVLDTDRMDLERSGIEIAPGYRREVKIIK